MHVHQNNTHTHFLTFIGPCIVINFYRKTNEMNQLLKFVLLCNSNLHASDGLSGHPQLPAGIMIPAGSDIPV